MKISAKWLKEYTDFEINSENVGETAHKLAILGFETESIEHIKNDYANFAVGKVIECLKHPNADKLSLCKVDVGTEVLPIVCGAPNVAAGQTVPVALEGAKVKDFVIKKTKIRGEESIGMICAEDELGLSDDHDGIMVLDDSLAAGTPLKELFGYEDHVLEFEVTSNRADALGYIGFAREFAYLTGSDLKIPEFSLEESNEKASDSVKISILDEKACPRYCGRVIKNVKVKESPDWLKQRLTAVGLRPINNVVDITNFVMLETGHPLHAFDFNNVSGREIIVKKAAKDEKFTTLDEKEFELNESILMICDAEKSVALAGVMGGMNSGVTEGTKDVLLEVAYFNLADIRETVKLTNLHTDSSKRFERGIDPNDSEFVINRAAALINELAGGEVLSGIVDVYPEKIKEKSIELRLSRTDKVLGFQIDKEKIISSFNTIGLKTEVKNSDTLSVIVPTFRPDITREIDLIEEAVRLYGYDRIPEVTLSTISLEPDINAEETLLDRARVTLKNLGLTETLSKSMVDGKFCAPFVKKPVKIDHPLNEEMNHLRNSLLVSLLQTADKNIRRKNENIGIFEAGKIFFYDESAIVEKNSVAALLTGIKNFQSWNCPESKYDFYDIKGLAEAFLSDFCRKELGFSPGAASPYFDKDSSVSVFLNDRLIGCFGELSEKTLKVFDIEQPVFCFEFDLENIEYISRSGEFKIRELSKYPKVIKDVSVLLEENDNAERVAEYIKKKAGSLLTSVTVVDLYKGEQVGENRKSYTFRMCFQSVERTLKDKEIEKLFGNIVTGLKNDLKLEIR
ncbi:MAG: phenylalanine--tRNA ligase subunit beta [Candidatus Delongbacteria bacterium]|nr:phenylalanine--tRNA ligase subunit beta [Candidatus Delongbacteria bacterium]